MGILLNGHRSTKRNAGRVAAPGSMSQALAKGPCVAPRSHRRRFASDPQLSDRAPRSPLRASE